MISRTLYIKWCPIAKDNKDAQFQIGLMYSFVNGLKLDHLEPIKWIKLAGNNGNRTAQLFLGDAYFDGKNIPQNFVEAK